MERPIDGWEGNLEHLLATEEALLFLRLEIERQVSDPFMEMVTVGDPGNLPDPITVIFQKGAVSYEFKIGKYEVTNAQYAELLNAVEATDSGGIYFFQLYNEAMGDDVSGRIIRSGDQGSYAYAAKPDMGDKPVNLVNWYHAVRFCNWLHNGRPTGPRDATTTEDGAYNLTELGGVVGSDPVHGANGRNAGARYHLPSENEWYKAAYYQPAERDGDADGYWLYPTRSNDPPTQATADATGNINNDTENISNYNYGAIWNGEGNVTTVGSGGPGSASYYGAFDMGGNVEEWVEQVFYDSRGEPWNRGQWGGSFGHFPQVMRSVNRVSDSHSVESRYRGFRVASP